MDWDILMRNAARGRDFTGQTAADEQAYFEAFAGDAHNGPALGSTVLAWVKSQAVRFRSRRFRAQITTDV